MPGRSDTLFSNSWRNTFGSKSSTQGASGMIRLRPTGLTFPVIFSGYQVAFNEKIQVLESFKDVTHVFAFGKAAGSATLSGHVLANGNSNPLQRKLKEKLFQVYDTKLRAFKAAKEGKLVMVSGPGNMVIQGVVIGLSMDMSAQLESVANFVLNMVITTSAQGI